MSDAITFVWFAFVDASGMVIGSGTTQQIMQDYVEAPTGSTVLFISEARYADTNITPGNWKRNAAGTDIERKAAVPVTVNKYTLTANGIDAVTITGIPNPSQVSVVGSGSEPAYVPLTDGTVTITTEDPGGIQVSIRSVGYTDWWGEFNAV